MALATYEDTLRYGETVRTELLAGEILFPPSPWPEHQYILSGLSQLSEAHKKDWWLLPAMDVRFTVHDVPCPDLSGWRRTVPLFKTRDPPVEFVPEFICEILSPESERCDRGYKADLYAAHRVGHLWLVDPHQRCLEAFALSSGRWSRIAVYDESTAARIPPFATVELDLPHLFPPHIALSADSCAPPWGPCPPRSASHR